MSEDDGHESGCDTVDGSPASDTHSSPFPERRFLNTNQKQQGEMRRSNAHTRTQMKAAVRTVVVPPLRVINNNNNQYQHGNTGNAHTRTLSNLRFSYSVLERACSLSLIKLNVTTCILRMQCF